MGRHLICTQEIASSTLAASIENKMGLSFTRLGHQTFNLAKRVRISSALLRGCGVNGSTTECHSVSTGSSPVICSLKINGVEVSWASSGDEVTIPVSLNAGKGQSRTSATSRMMTPKSDQTTGKASVNHAYLKDMRAWCLTAAREASILKVSVRIRLSA